MKKVSQDKSKEGKSNEGKLKEGKSKRVNDASTVNCESKSDLRVQSLTDLTRYYFQPQVPSTHSS